MLLIFLKAHPITHFFKNIYFKNVFSQKKKSKRALSTAKKSSAFKFINTNAKQKQNVQSFRKSSAPYSSQTQAH